MSILLFGVGTVAFAVGVAMVGFGIPINEFSFGNTLIAAGTTAAVGGLIVIGLGIVVVQLQRVADALATRTPIRSNRPFNTYEQAAGVRPPVGPARIPFPPKQKMEPKAEASPREPHPAEGPAGVPFKDQLPDYLAPTLPNPDEAPVTVEDEVSLSPQHPMAPSASTAAAFQEPVRRTPPASPYRDHDTEMDEERSEQPPFDAGWRPPSRPPEAPARRPQATYFDALWPTEPKPAEATDAESKAPESKPPEPKWAESRQAEPKRAEFKSSESGGINRMRTNEDTPAPTFEHLPDEPVQPPEEEPRAVAILKSGVVDGMGYTLYVDGSIEAELPQGTLRFASISELRSHLEKTS